MHHNIGRESGLYTAFSHCCTLPPCSHCSSIVQYPTGLLLHITSPHAFPASAGGLCANDYCRLRTNVRAGQCRHMYTACQPTSSRPTLTGPFKWAAHHLSNTSVMCGWAVYIPPRTETISGPQCAFHTLGLGVSQFLMSILFYGYQYIFLMSLFLMSMSYVITGGC
jgi:hypothetical protein